MAISLGAGIAVAVLCLLAARAARMLASRFEAEWSVAVRERFPDLFLFVDPIRSVQTAVVAVVAICAAVLIVTGSIWVTATTLSAAALVPRVLVAILRRRRLRRLAEQLPDALASLAAALRSGMGLTQAIALTAAQQPAPISQELALVIRKQRLGVSTDEAMQGLEQRVAVPEFSSFATAVRVAREAGGSLAESLERLAGTTRRRLALQARVTALTSQGRLQGVVLGALPVLLMAVLSAMEPAAMRLLWTTTGGFAVLALIAVLETAGFLMIRAVVGIRV
jgi:tight adherence protein B